jgi:nucleoside phosphorylase
MLFMAAVKEELGDLDGEVVGIGPILAAARTAEILARRRPEAVVLLGTGGAYAGGPAIGEAIVASVVGMSYGVAAMGLGYVPRPPAPAECDASLVERIGLPVHRVLTVNAITTDPTLADRIRDSWTVEHMEAFGVALACRNAGVPFTAVLGITNEVGPEAHTQWLTHRDAAQAAARAAVGHLR